MEGFIDLNTFEHSGESFKKIMIDHELIFKKQVHDLHRLYEVQKSIMKGESKNKNKRHELFPMKRTFTESHSVGSRRFLLNNSFLQDDQDFRSTFQQKPIDLGFSSANSDDDDVLNLSLSIGSSTTYKRSKIYDFFPKRKIVYPSPHDIIDLEDSTETGSNEDDALPLNQVSDTWHDVKRTKNLDLDLNKDQPCDESSFHSNEPSGTFPSSEGSYGESCTKPKSQTSEKDGQTKVYTIDLESLPELSSESAEENVIDIVREQNERKAALSLIFISQQRTLIINQGSEENKKTTITRSSSIDSYEKLVLNLEDNDIDEDSATSRAFEPCKMNELLDRKEKNGIKLRRGTRMKDFRKDILPTISSLSRHEIWEDIKILESVIKSREYKRLNKAKSSKGKGEKWFTPVKSKRSKVNYVGQRC